MNDIKLMNQSSTKSLQPAPPAPRVEPTERKTRHENRRVGAWHVRANAYDIDPQRSDYGAHVDLHAFAVVDGAICSFQMGLPVAAARALYEALGKVLTEPAEPCVYCGPGAHWSPECPTVTTADPGYERGLDVQP